VLAGNGGNGLRITNADDTTVQANFLGTAADNATAVPNGGNGILVSGTSANAIVGGVIPLGNVTSGNNAHGINVTDQSTGFVSFNTFAGMAAFGGAIPNRLNGIQITATGGNNLIRTCLVAGNLGNGIVIGGDATGVTVEDTAAGTNSAISEAIPNGGSGIVITGTAHGNAIGGFQPSVETKVHMSGNGRYGIEVRGNAYDNVIFNTVVGAGFRATDPLPNALGGIFLGQGTSGTVIGGTQPLMANRVLFNNGSGITVAKASSTRIAGNEIRSNLGSGLWINGGFNNRIGEVAAGNQIISNSQNGIYATGETSGTTVVANTILGSGGSGIFLNAVRLLQIGRSTSEEANDVFTSEGYGLYATGDCPGTSVIRNRIFANELGNVDISSATGITYVP